MATAPKVPMQLKVDKMMMDHIKRTARTQSAEKDEDISWQDLVRNALDKVFSSESGSTKGKK
jgi:hypothetical protein